MKYTEAIDRLREAKRDALANSCNIKIGRRELEIALKALNIVSKELPDMREKVREYISELDAEIDRCVKKNEKILENTNISHGAMIINQFQLAEKIEILTKVKNDLQSRLDELI